MMVSTSVTMMLVFVVIATIVPATIAQGCSCPSANGKVCGGHGMCAQCECICNTGWVGKACECSNSDPIDENYCFSDNGKVCNGSGECICGVCHCSRLSGNFGPVCEDCPTCPGNCNNPSIQACALCKAFSSGPKDQEQCDRCLDYSVVDYVEEDRYTADQTQTKMCKFVDKADGCTVKFNYKYAANNIGAFDIFVLDTKSDCPENNPNSAAKTHHQHTLLTTLTVLCGAVIHVVGKMV